VTACRSALAINGLLGEHYLLVAQQGGSQDREVLVGLQAAEGLLGHQQSGAGPTSFIRARRISACEARINIGRVRGPTGGISFE
jgi:hypothetical protein